VFRRLGNPERKAGSDQARCAYARGLRSLGSSAVTVPPADLDVSPCHGIRVTTGDYEVEPQVAKPVEFLRAALRMYDLMGYRGFVLTLMNGYTGAPWSELISQKPGHYDQVNYQIPIRRPIREARGHIEEAPRPKSPAGRRFPQKRTPPVLAGFTFHEGRHTHRTWLSDDGISDIGRAARLGHKLPGMADVYEDLTPEMKQRTVKVLQARWETSIAQLTSSERAKLLAIVPATPWRHHGA
jgi:hypothetical protein